MKHNRVHSQIKLQPSPPKDKELQWQPYRDIPFTPKQQVRPLLQRINRDMSCVIRNQKVRKFASKQIQEHFLEIHGKYKSKENLHNNCFRIKAKREENEKQGEGFWLSRLHPRQQGMMSLMEEYLRQVGNQLSRRKKWTETDDFWSKQEKVIKEYNIIYDYRCQKLPKCLPK